MFETYTKYSLVADGEQKKKKVLGVFYGSLQQTYTRYSGVADEEQKKKVLGVFYGSL